MEIKKGTLLGNELSEEKRTAILFSAGVDTDRPDCYSEGWYPYILNLLTFNEENVNKMAANNQDFIILVGSKGYDEPGIKPHEMFFTYKRLLEAGLSYEEALAELLKFYEAEPFLVEAPESTKHVEHWDKRYIVPSRENDRIIIRKKALALEKERWLH